MKKTALIVTIAIFALAGCDKPAEKAAEKPAASQPAMNDSMAPQQDMAGTMMAPHQDVTGTMMAPSMEPGLSMPSGHPDMGMGAPHDMPSGVPAGVALQRATVVSSIDVPQFTYIEVEQDGKTRWLAGTTIEVKKGDVVEFAEDSTIDNFTSKTLNRTFDTLTFISHAEVVKDEQK